MRASLREPLLAFGAAIGLASALFWIGHAVPVVHRNLHVLVAVVFFYVPVVAGRLAGRPFDFRAAGLTLEPVGRGAAVLGVALAITFPLFIAGFFAFYGAVCGHGTGVASAGLLGGRLGAMCPGTWRGWAGGHLRLPPDFALVALNQLVVIALPEELFFRGYLLGRLEERFPPRAQLAGAPVGVALVLSAALFALGHVLVDLNPQRLAVFFPALVFGWMRSRSGALAAGATYHALCNLLSDVLHTSFF